MLANTVQFIFVHPAVVPAAKAECRKFAVTPFVSLPARMAPAPPPLATKQDDRRDSGSTWGRRVGGGGGEESVEESVQLGNPVLHLEEEESVQALRPR